jgi:3-dehydroquinate dehydratase-2
MQILILNGPNLNRLGYRARDIYGTRTMAQILLDIQQRWLDVHFVYRQSNHEGDLIDWIQEVQPTLAPSDEHEPIAGIILNAGGYSHTSVAIHDDIASIKTPVVEVHISNIYAREEYRRHSLLSDACMGVICGMGLEGYRLAIEGLVQASK